MTEASPTAAVKLHRPEPWTPAPWSLGTVAVVIDGGYYQAPDEAIIYCGPDTAQDENEIRVDGPDALANARLIAAAPELYEALKNITDCYGVGSTPERFCEHVRSFMEEGRTALAKARGETP